MFYVFSARGLQACSGLLLQLGWNSESCGTLGIMKVFLGPDLSTGA